MDLLTDFSITQAHTGAGIARLEDSGSSGSLSGLEVGVLAPLTVPPRQEPCSDPSIERFDGTAALRIVDPRLFASESEAFCRALVESAVMSCGFRQAEISLSAAACRLEFDPGCLDRAQVAERAASAIRSATRALRRSAEGPLRAAPDWTSLTAFATGKSSRPSLWETRAVEAGRLRLRHRALWRRSLAERAAILLRAWPGVEDCRRIPGSAEVEIQFDIEVLSPEDVVLASEAALRVARRWRSGTLAGCDSSQATGDESGSGATWDLLVAGGSLLLAFAGLVLPGIPAVPFFMLGCNSLSHHYPELRASLLSLPGVGHLLCAAAASRNPNQWRDPQFIAKTLLVGFLVSAFVLILQPPLPLVLACEIGTALFSIH